MHEALAFLDDIRLAVIVHLCCKACGYGDDRKIRLKRKREKTLLLQNMLKAIIARGGVS